VGLDNPDRPLRSRLLQVPAWRTKYLRYVGEIARDELDWQRLGPLVAELRGLAEPLVEVDTRKLSSLEAFQTSTSEAPSADAPARGSMELRRFADQRRAYLLAHPEIQAALAETSIE
jgi:hypothetical protein